MTRTASRKHPGTVASAGSAEAPARPAPHPGHRGHRPPLERFGACPSDDARRSSPSM